MAGKNYMHQLDAKNRMRIPAKLREMLGEGYAITVGVESYLCVYTKEQAKNVKSTLKNLNPYRASTLNAARYILYNFWDAEEDKQGRILLPENLRKHAKIQKNVLVFEGPNCIEIWSEEVWNDTFNNINFEDLADAFDEINAKNG